MERYLAKVPLLKLLFSWLSGFEVFNETPAKELTEAYTVIHDVDISLINC